MMSNVFSIVTHCCSCDAKLDYHSVFFAVKLASTGEKHGSGRHVDPHGEGLRGKEGLTRDKHNILRTKLKIHITHPTIHTAQPTIQNINPKRSRNPA